MWSIRVEQDRVRVGERLAISFQRTLRIPDDGRAYPLPPTLGTFPLRRAADYPRSLPDDWDRSADALARTLFIPMYQREALWLAFEAAAWKPNAVKIGVGRVNALTGAGWDSSLNADPQDYLVCPDQPWLDGINSGTGVIRQFVAMPLGQGYTIEGQVSGQEQFGGIQALVFDPRPGIFPDEPPPPPPVDALSGMFGQPFGAPLGGPAAAPLAAMAGGPAQDLGLAAGGQITQKIYPDRYGLDTWETSSYGEVFIYIVNTARYMQITGELPPPSPIDAQTYSRHGFPWFDWYDADRSDLPASQKLAGVKTVAELDAEGGLPASSDEQSVDISPDQVKKISDSDQRSSGRQVN